jgi:hypothetical protein
MRFNKYEFRNKIIDRLKTTRQHFADISDIVNDFIGNDTETKKENERELIHLARNMKILDIKEWEADPGKMNDDWLEVFKKSNVKAGDKIEGLYASLTKDYFANIRQKRIYYICVAILATILLAWAIDKLLTHPSQLLSILLFSAQK